MMTKRLAVEFVSKSWEEYLYWQQQDKKTLKRIDLYTLFTKIG